MIWNGRSKKIVCLSISALLSFGIIGYYPCLGETPEPTLASDAAYILFEDNFDGDSLDESKWERYDGVERCNGADFWDGEMAYTDGNGRLILKAEWNPKESRVHSGAVHTNDDFSGGYGYYEASIRFPETYGIWGAFWSKVGHVSGVDDSSADGAELDIIESIGSHECLCNHAIHWDGYGDGKKTEEKTHAYIDIYDGSFHTFALWRTETNYIFYIDGKETWRTQAGGICPLGGDIRLSVESAEWSGAGTEEGIAALPSEMEVDFVRVWNTNPYPNEVPARPPKALVTKKIDLWIDNPVMQVNGEKKSIDSEGTVPIVMNGSTLTPIRAIVEEFGGEVQWDGATKTVHLTCGVDEITLRIGDTTAFFNGEAYTLATAPILLNGRTMLPIRFIAEKFHIDVGWDGATRNVTLTKSYVDINRYTARTQRLRIRTASNARQLGGYICGDKWVKNDLLLRSGQLSWLMENDIKVLKEEYNLKYIVDFRAVEDIAAEPDVEIPGVEYYSLPVYSSEMFSNEAKQKLGQIESEDGDHIKMSLGYAENRIITDRYERILLTKRAQEAYAKFFDLLVSAGEDEAVLWHCSLGKDRSGLASALLLFALGGDMDMVIRDFEITNEVYADDLEELRSIAQERGLDEDTAVEFYAAEAGVDARYLKMAVDSVEREYGSMDNYLRDALGLSDAEKQALRDKYLQSNKGL